MTFLDYVEEAAAVTHREWSRLSTQRKIRIARYLGVEVATLFSDKIAAARSAYEMYRIIEEYRDNPHQIARDLVGLVLPDLIERTDAQQRLTPGIDPETRGRKLVTRPVILVPGMVGTRLRARQPVGQFLPQGADVPGDMVSALEDFFRQPLSPMYGAISIPQVRRSIAEFVYGQVRGNIYDDRAIWDPDTKQTLVSLMYKTPTDRGILMSDLVPGEPYETLSKEAADSMTVQSLLHAITPGPGQFAMSAIDAAIAAAQSALGANAASVPGLEHLLSRRLATEREFEDLRRDRIERGWGRPVWQVSKNWLLPLERRFGKVAWVYGYDWRQDLSEAAKGLVRFIRQVRSRSEGRRPILLTHSFGGIVARAAARRDPEQVAGIVQVFSPTAGAVKPYSYFKKGAGSTVLPDWQSEDPPSTDDLRGVIRQTDLINLFTWGDAIMSDSAPFAVLLGWDSNAFLASSAGVGGLYSLLPNNRRRFRQDPAPWLQVEGGRLLEEEVARLRNIFEVYRRFDLPTGLLEERKWQDAHTLNQALAPVRAALVSGASSALSLKRLLQWMDQRGYLRALAPEPLSADYKAMVRRRVLHGIEAAEALDAELGNWVHPNTWTLWSRGHYTDIAFRIRNDGQRYRYSRIVHQHPDRPGTPVRTARDHGLGDGTLEMASARSLLGTRGTVYVPRIEHAHGMDDELGRGAMLQAVYMAMVAAHKAEKEEALHQPATPAP